MKQKCDRLVMKTTISDYSKKTSEKQVHVASEH